MRSILHHIVLASAVMASAALAPNTAAAETVKVPFNFTVAGQTWPAGVYSVKKDSSGNLVTLSSRDAKKNFSCVIGPGAPGPTETLVTLRFDNMGETHSLRFVQYGSLISSPLNVNKRNAYASSRLSQGR